MPQLTAAQYLSRRLARKKLAGRSKAKTAAQKIGLLMQEEQRFAHLRRIPDCFGKKFDAPENARCRACHVPSTCMHRTAHTTFLEEQQRLGTNSIAQLAEGTGRRPAVIRRLQHLCAITGAISAKAVNSIESEEDPEPRNSWPARFLRERRRIKELDYLPVGARLFRTYKGKTYTIHVAEGSYILDAVPFPTLYAIAMELTGKKDYARSKDNPTARRTMSNFSVRKFFFTSIEHAMMAL